MGASVRWGRRNYGRTGTMDALGLWMRRGYGRVGSLRYTKYEEEIGWDFLTILEVK